MEIYYKQIIDGINMPFDQAKTLFDMVKMVYDTLSISGQITTDQVKVYEELKKILTTQK